MTVYTSLNRISELQETIMKYVDWWVKNEKTPIPQKKIVEKMEEDGVKNYTTVNALKNLLKNGYLRRAHIISNKTYYVQLRRV